jgi:hypothetical protein
MVTFFVDRDDLMDFPLVGYGVCGHAQLIQGSKVGQRGMRTDLYQTGIDIVTSISFVIVSHEYSNDNQPPYINYSVIVHSCGCGFVVRFNHSNFMSYL